MIPSFAEQKGTFVPLAGNSEWDKLVGQSELRLFSHFPNKDLPWVLLRPLFLQLVPKTTQNGTNRLSKERI